MRVFKFGGASVKNADAVRNVKNIINLFDDDLTIVISAMGKTTNALEEVVNAHAENDLEKAYSAISQLKSFHQEIIRDLDFESEETEAKIYQIIDDLKARIDSSAAPNYNYDYDQIVSLGEVMSTTIISDYLNKTGCPNFWLDARKLVRTDNNYREGIVDWETTKTLVTEKVNENVNAMDKYIGITQGFLGHTDTFQTTTLGREGSDYTAAILAWCLEAKDVTIWKDVPGVLNADPKWFDNCEKLDKISFKEAIELSYYGASVIHPKTIKPLQNKEIPLYVKSFVTPEAEGTVIQSSIENDHLIPSFIFKMNQILISISPKDFSFIMEKNLSHIFELFSKYGVKINLMQNSAISFSVCTDFDIRKSPDLIKDLKETYNVKYNQGLELVTIRHYDQKTIDRVTVNKAILVEQKSRHTARMVMRELNNE